MAAGSGLGDVRLGVVDYIESGDGLTFLARFAFSFGGWQSRDSILSFPQREQNFLGGHLVLAGMSSLLATPTALVSAVRGDGLIVSV